MKNINECDGKVSVFTNISGPKHFIILCYDVKGKDGLKVHELFDKINGKCHLGDTWLFKIGDKHYSMSMRLYTWQAYKAMLFSDGVNKQFRNQCLKDRGCYLDFKVGEAILLGWGSERSTDISKAPMLNKNLKSLLFQALFGCKLSEKENIQQLYLLRNKEG